MKRVVSVSLFLGPQASRDVKDPFYYDFVRPWVRAHHNCFPDWEARVHHDSPPGFLEACPYGPTLRRLGMHDTTGGEAPKVPLVTLVDCGPAELRNAAMLWRLKPLFDPDVECVIFRDIDSIPTPRDRRAVEEWLASGMEAHGIADSISHTSPLLGGMSGFLAATFRERFGWGSWDAMIRAAREFMGSAWQKPGLDQSFLNGYLWPRVCGEAFLHRLKGRHPAHGGRIVRERIWDRLPENVPSEVLAGGDAWLPHLGASGFDWILSTDFYQRHGRPEVERRIAAAESAAAG